MLRSIEKLNFPSLHHNIIDLTLTYQFKTNY